MKVLDAWNGELVYELEGDAPVVGKLYRVLSVHTDDIKMQGWFPALGPRHDDLELSFPEQHWHFDLRFVDGYLDDPKVTTFRMDNGAAAGVEGNAEHPAAAFGVITDDDLVEPPTMKIWRCMRKMPPNPCNFIRLAYWYRDHKIDPENPVCPHKGMPLSGVPSVLSCLICPLHGLIWDKKTGEAVNHTQLLQRAGE